MKPWVINGQTAIWCNGLGPLQATWDAVAEYNNAAPWPFQEFTHQCGANQSIDIVDNTGPWGPIPPDCGQEPRVVGCAQYSWYEDANRGGFYKSYVRIWVNRVHYQYTYNGLRAAMTHELGHVYGLDEQYLHPGCNPADPQALCCNPNSYSVMDAVTINSGFFPPRVEGGCDVNTIDSNTLNNSQELYVMSTGAFQPQNLTSWKVTTNSMLLYWDDRSPTESKYNIYKYYWHSGGYWKHYITDVRDGGGGARRSLGLPEPVELYRDPPPWLPGHLVSELHVHIQRRHRRALLDVLSVPVSGGVTVITYPPAS